MIRKSERKAKSIAKLNAKQVTRRDMWSSSPTKNHLTEHAEKNAEKLWELSGSCRVVTKKANELHWVCVPCQPNHKNESPVPSFCRVREAKTASGTRASCSCGLPSRKKWPCHHMMAVVGRTHPKMCSVRWHAQHGHFFHREGNDTMTELFREMEEKEERIQNDVGEGKFCGCLVGCS